MNPPIRVASLMLAWATWWKLISCTMDQTTQFHVKKCHPMFSFIYPFSVAFYVKNRKISLLARNFRKVEGEKHITKNYSHAVGVHLPASSCLNYMQRLYIATTFL